MISKRYRVVALSVWPGLPQIWAGQILFGLTLAMFFALTVNLAVVSQWVYTRWIDGSTRQILWVVTSLFYAGMTTWTIVWAWKFHPERYKIEIEGLYRTSNENYLKGRWADARDQLESLIALDPSDTEALLRLSRLLIRTDRPDLARRVLDQCRDTARARHWKWEIDQVANALARRDKSSDAASHTENQAGLTV